MDSPGRHAGRQQGETMAVGTDGGTRERDREGKRRAKREGGVAVLLNFNEYQGEFLPHIFFFFLAPFPFFLFFSWDAPIDYMALNDCHTNEL